MRFLSFKVFILDLVTYMKIKGLDFLIMAQVFFKCPDLRFKRKNTHRNHKDSVAL